MKLDPIIVSLLETDLYKFSMGAVIHKLFNEYKTKWTFKCRNKGVKFTPEMISEIRAQIDHFCALKFTTEELQKLRKLAPWISDGYFNHLVDWTPKRAEIKVNEGNIQAYSDCGLAIEAEGTWLNTSMYEIPILAIVNEVYFAFTGDKVKNDIEFQKKVREVYLRQCETDPEFIRIDCSAEDGSMLPPDVISDAVRKVVNEHLGL